MDSLTAQYTSAPDSTSPVGSAHAQQPMSSQEHKSDIARILSKLELLDRELSRAKHRIQQLETHIGLIEQRVNSRL